MQLLSEPVVHHILGTVLLIELELRVVRRGVWDLLELGGAARVVKFIVHLLFRVFKIHWSALHLSQDGLINHVIDLAYSGIIFGFFGSFINLGPKDGLATSDFSFPLLAWLIWAAAATSVSFALEVTPHEAQQQRTNSHQNDLPF